jgi:hypothetical protein
MVDARNRTRRKPAMLGGVARIVLVVAAAASSFRATSP